MNDLFFIDDEEEENSSSHSPTTKEEPEKIKKVTTDEVFEELYERAIRKRKIKTSVFSKLDRDILKTLSEYIVTKKMSYRVALDKLKELYPDNESLQEKRHESLRYYLIKHNFIVNEKALETINRSISKSQYARNKRERIVADVIEEIIENHLDKIIEHPLFQEKLQQSLSK